MATIELILADGSQRRLSADSPATLMAVATEAGVPGIVGECGGALMCATCHVYVDEAWLDQLPSPGDDELMMLESTMSPRLPGSRLCCQIPVNDSTDGLVVRIPSAQ